MARLGRPRKWVAKKVSQADLQQLKILSRRDDASAVALIRGFATFCSLNKNITSRSLMITAFAGQQLQQGMQASSVSTNLQILKSSRVSIENPLAALDQLQLASTERALVRTTARRGGPKLKRLMTLKEMMDLLEPAGLTLRDQEYQCLWYILVATGMRPCHSLTASFKFNTTALLVTYNGRKSEKEARRRAISHPFFWSAPPPPYVRKILVDAGGKLPPIGTENNIAACMNSWLKKRQLEMTSSLPRVRMDNHLRDQVEAGTLTERMYEVVMDHTLDTSDHHYRQ